MQKHSLGQRIQRKEKWCHKMEKKLAVIVDNKEVTTEIADTKCVHQRVTWRWKRVHHRVTTHTEAVCCLHRVNM